MVLYIYIYRSFGNMLLDDDSHETVDDNEILSRRAVSFVDCPVSIYNQTNIT